MLLNHILTIEKAGGRKADIGLFDRGECLLVMEHSEVYFYLPAKGGRKWEKQRSLKIEYCIQHNILKEFLSKQKAEVIKMSIFEYDEEREIELIRRDEREIGKEIGKEIGQKIGEEIGAEKERENTIKSIISFGKKLGASKEQIIKELQERCLLEEQEAEKKVTLHWNE